MYGNLITLASEADKSMAAIHSKMCIRDIGSTAVFFTCADILYFIRTGLNGVCKCELEVAGTGSGEGIFIFVFQPNEDLSFRWIGSVSYTHLDVYKRQILFLSNIGKVIMN